MGHQPKKSFAAAAVRDDERIINAIRAPEKEYLTARFVTSRPKKVADFMLAMALAGETEAVASFIASDPVRVHTLNEKKQMRKVMSVLEQLDTAQQVKALSATESYLYGTPNATVLQTIAGDKSLTKRFRKMLLGFDRQQRTQVFAAPGAPWWMSSHSHDDLMAEVLSPLSKKERQHIVSKSGDIATVLNHSDNAELDALFRNCRFRKGHAPMPRL